MVDFREVYATFKESRADKNHVYHGISFNELMELYIGFEEWQAEQGAFYEDEYNTPEDF